MIIMSSYPLILSQAASTKVKLGTFSWYVRISMDSKTVTKTVTVTAPASSLEAFLIRVV
jgi:hypothetical protein